MRGLDAAVLVGVVLSTTACYQRPSGRFGDIGHRGGGEFGGSTPAPARLSGVAHSAADGLHVTDAEGIEHTVRTDASTLVVVGGRAAPGVEAVPEGSEVRAVFRGTSTDAPAARIDVVRARR